MEVADMQRIREADTARDDKKIKDGMDLICEARKLLIDYEMHFKENHTGLRYDVLVNNLVLARNQLKHL